MKKYILLFIILVLAIMFSGCNSEPAPEIEDPEPAPEISEPVIPQKTEEPEIYEYDGVPDEATVYIYGKNRYITVKAGYEFKGWGDNSWKVTEVHAQHPEAPGPNRYSKDVGVFLSGEQSFEGYLKRNDAYDDAYDFIAKDGETYYMPCLVMDGEIVRKDIFRAIFDENLENKPNFDTDEILYCKITVNAMDICCSSLGFCDSMNITKIEPLPTPAAKFAFSENGETKSIAINEKIGDWTLYKLDIRLDENSGELERAEGTFVGNIVLEGKIQRNIMAEEDDDIYDLVITDEESTKIPHYIFPSGIKISKRFTLSTPYGLENIPDIDYGEELKVRVTVSDYSFFFTAGSAMPNMTVTKIEILE